MNDGYAGRLLFVDLTSGQSEIRELSDELKQLYVGGYGIGAKILFDLVEPGTDPLGPGNALGFMTGPFTGTGVLFGARYMVVCKSPVTGGWNDANSGGFWGVELKKAGFDGVFVTGASKSPVYIWIKDGAVEIRDAGALWGRDAVETIDDLAALHEDTKLRAAVIGPGGEKLSLMAGIVNEGHRFAARGGLGAVMGSKNLKAIAVRGTGKVAVADPDKLKQINREMREGLKSGPSAQTAANYKKWGTGTSTGIYALSGDSPVKNWGGAGVRDLGEPSIRKIEADAMDRYKVKKYGCASCPIACGAAYEMKEGEWALPEKTYRPEYETASAFGTNCLNDDAESIIMCNDICNRFGLDTMSVGSTIAWAIECFENGLINEEQTGGLKLTWGNAREIVRCTREICDQSTPFGKTLAKGSAAAANELGLGHEFLVTASGIELPQHDPRFAPGYARTYQYDPAPGRHTHGGLGGMHARSPGDSKYVTEGTGPLEIRVSTMQELLHIAGACLFSIFAKRDYIPGMLEAVTGYSFDPATQVRIMRRTMNMRHAFNLREGLTPKDFDISARAVGEPSLEEGPLKGVTVDHRTLAKNFFTEMQWDPVTGKPSRESLETLGGLEQVIADLYAA